jgi:hypothetical protein
MQNCKTKNSTCGVGHQSCAQRGKQLSVAQKAAKSPKMAKWRVKLTQNKGSASIF